MEVINELQKIEDFVLKYMGPGGNRELPAAIQNASKDLETLLGSFHKIIEGYKSAKSYEKFFKRKALKTHAKRLSVKMRDAVQLFHVSQVRNMGYECQVMINW